MMIHDLRIYRSDGTLRKVIPGRKLSKEHWKKFNITGPKGIVVGVKPTPRANIKGDYIPSTDFVTDS